jgi:hypothetical protein
VFSFLFLLFIFYFNQILLMKKAWLVESLFRHVNNGIFI